MYIHSCIGRYLMQQKSTPMINSPGGSHGETWLREGCLVPAAVQNLGRVSVCVCLYDLFVMLCVLRGMSNRQATSDTRGVTFSNNRADPYGARQRSHNLKFAIGQAVNVLDRRLLSTIVGRWS